MQELCQIIILSDKDCKINMFKWLMTQISVPEVLYTQPYAKSLLKLKIHYIRHSWREKKLTGL